eukprot:TRINITY_DN9603_c0_g1_i1.p1 TRINITY_DN9603_c0_g1~~TRINITY_DN9603_c0_g1_i1.p1  ORF type:complete len:137 (+),score=38.50 TRINITY_DN9603_c0_g1_i1:87-497(+)
MELDGAVCGFAALSNFLGFTTEVCAAEADVYTPTTLAFTIVYAILLLLSPLWLTALFMGCAMANDSGRYRTSLQNLMMALLLPLPISLALALDWLRKPDEASKAEILPILALLAWVASFAAFWAFPLPSKVRERSR